MSPEDPDVHRCCSNHVYHQHHRSVSDDTSAFDELWPHHRSLKPSFHAIDAAFKLPCRDPFNEIRSSPVADQPTTPPPCLSSRSTSPSSSRFSRRRRAPPVSKLGHPADHHSRLNSGEVMIAQLCITICTVYVSPLWEVEDAEWP